MTPNRHTFYHSQPVTWPTVMKVNIGKYKAEVNPNNHIDRTQQSGTVDYFKLAPF